MAAASVPASQHGVPDAVGLVRDGVAALRDGPLWPLDGQELLSTLQQLAEVENALAAQRLRLVAEVEARGIDPHQQPRARPWRQQLDELGRGEPSGEVDDERTDGPDPRAGIAVPRPEHRSAIIIEYLCESRSQRPGQEILNA